MNLATALETWKSSEYPMIVEHYGEDDEPALNESWNNYTDLLCKGGEINATQYHHCPAWDDEKFPGDDEELDWLLEQMGATVSSIAKDRAKADEQGYINFSCELKRSGVHIDFDYKQSQGLGSDVDSESMLAYLFATAIKEDDVSYEGWCEGQDLDPGTIKSRLGFIRCQQIDDSLDQMFTRQEREDLEDMTYGA